MTLMFFLPFFLQHAAWSGTMYWIVLSLWHGTKREKMRPSSVPSVPFAFLQATLRRADQSIKDLGATIDIDRRSSINSSRPGLDGQCLVDFFVRSRHRSGQDRARATGAKYRAVIPTLSLQMLSVAIMERFKIRSFVKFFPHYLRWWPEHGENQTLSDGERERERGTIRTDQKVKNHQELDAS